MKNVTLAALLLLLAACWEKPIFPNHAINVQLDRLDGQQADSAIAKLGKPDKEEMTSENRTYSWAVSKKEKPKGWWDEHDPAADRSDQRNIIRHCSLEIYTDRSKKIIGHDFEGDAHACAIFAARLDPSYHQE